MVKCWKNPQLWITQIVFWLVLTSTTSTLTPWLTSTKGLIMMKLWKKPIQTQVTCLLSQKSTLIKSKRWKIKLNVSKKLRPKNSKKCRPAWSRKDKSNLNWWSKNKLKVQILRPKERPLTEWWRKRKHKWKRNARKMPMSSTKWCKKNLTKNSECNSSEKLMQDYKRLFRKLLKSTVSVVKCTEMMFCMNLSSKQTSNRMALKFLK